MFKLIIHRRNTIEELRSTPVKYGIEVDIRSYGDRLVIHHDPFVKGVDFIEWIENYKHGTLILNVKEEGLENRLINVMDKYSIKDFFFLDQSFPFLIKWSNQSERRCAVRVSEFEGIETALKLAGRIDWVWVDCFTKFPLTAEQSNKLIESGFLLCIVSPELQGRDPGYEIPALADLLVQNEVRPTAICTKRPDLWESLECKFKKS